MTVINDIEHAERMKLVDREARFALWNSAAILHAARGESIQQAVDEAMDLADLVDERLVAAPEITLKIQELERNGVVLRK